MQFLTPIRCQVIDRVVINSWLLIFARSIPTLKACKIVSQCTHTMLCDTLCFAPGIQQRALAIRRWSRALGQVRHWEALGKPRWRSGTSDDDQWSFSTNQPNLIGPLPFCESRVWRVNFCFTVKPIAASSGRKTLTQHGRSMRILNFKEEHIEIRLQDTVAPLSTVPPQGVRRELPKRCGRSVEYRNSSSTSTQSSRWSF